MAIEFPGIRIEVCKSASETDGLIAIFEEKTAPGAGPPLHRHLHQTEVFHVRRGRYLIRIEEEIFDLMEGDCAVVLPGKRHAFKNVGSEEGNLVFELIPANDAEVFFEKASRAQSEDEIATLFTAYGNELLGPSEL